MLRKESNETENRLSWQLVRVVNRHLIKKSARGLIPYKRSWDESWGEEDTSYRPLADLCDYTGAALALCKAGSFASPDFGTKYLVNEANHPGIKQELNEYRCVS